jgi:hypothetical protein
MNPVEVKTALMTVFLKIQTKCGLECPPLDGTSVPPKVLPKFDSTVWPAATTLLAQALKIIIPNDVHIFGGKHGGPLLTLDETISLVCRSFRKLAESEIIAAE